jgi:hypothetical protein
METATTIMSIRAHITGFAAALCLSAFPGSPVIPVAAHAQGAIDGLVTGAGSGAPVIGAEVRLVGRSRPTYTGTNGRFTLDNINAGEYEIRVARIGFRVHRSVVSVDTGTVAVSIELSPAAFRLSEIVVTPGHFGVMEVQMPASQQTLTREDIETIPQLGEDIFRAVKRLPGIAADDISTKLNVRGGTDQELLVRIDGMELYEPYHLKDFDAVLGIMDVNSLGGVELVTGGFPVEHGDKLTGVFDMQSRTPPLRGARTALGLSIMNLSFMSQGGLAGGKGQWLVAARRGYLDIALALTGGDDDLSPKYYDVFGKFQYRPHPNHRLSAHTLHANDGLRVRDDEFDLDSGWNSNYGWLTWEATFPAGATVTTTAYGGRVTRNRLGEAEEIGRISGPEFADVADDRRFLFAGVKQDMTYELSDRAMLKVGADLKSATADYDYFSATRTIIVTPDGELGHRFDTTAVGVEPSGNEVGAYVAARVRPVDAITAEVGVRYDRISHTGDDDWAPRMLLSVDLLQGTTLRGSWGRYFQSHGLHELDVGDGETAFFPSDRAEQVALGLDHRFGGGLNLRLEAYHRAMSDLRPRYVNADREIQAFPETEGDRLRIDPTEARARGVEFLLARDQGRRLAWSISYVLAKAEDRVDGRWIPRTLDQRHALGLHFAYRPTRQWQLSWSWQFRTGWPATASTFAVDTLTDGTLQLARDPGPLNALRLPSYHRLDVRLTRNFFIKSNVLQVYFDIFNLYNRHNLRSYDYGVSVRDGRVLVTQFDGDELLPVLPSLGVRWEF